MTMINSTNTFDATAFGAATHFSMLSFGSSAEAAQSLSSCQGGSSKAVVDCCDKLIKS